MDAGRQLLRFSIPGSILLLWTLGTVIVVRLIAGVPLSEATAAVRENVAAVIAIFAAIPVGFLVYQLYYFAYRPTVFLWPLPWHGRWVRVDRGHQVLGNFTSAQHEALRELFGVKLDMSTAHGEDQSRGIRKIHMLVLAPSFLEAHGGDATSAHREYKRRWHENWDVLRAVVDISEASEATRGIKREYTVLADLYHALGASRTAITLGWAIGISMTGLAMVHRGEVAVNWLIAIPVTMLPTLAVAFVVHHTRRQTWLSAANSLIYGLRWVFDNHPQLFEPDTGTTDAAEGPVYRLRNAAANALRLGDPART